MDVCPVAYMLSVYPIIHIYAVIVHDILSALHLLIATLQDTLLKDQVILKKCDGPMTTFFKKALQKNHPRLIMIDNLTHDSWLCSVQNKESP